MASNSLSKAWLIQLVLSYLFHTGLTAVPVLFLLQHCHVWVRKQQWQCTSNSITLHFCFQGLIISWVTPLLPLLRCNPVQTGPVTNRQTQCIELFPPCFHFTLPLSKLFPCLIVDCLRDRGAWIAGIENLSQALPQLTKDGYGVLATKSIKKHFKVTENKRKYHYGFICMLLMQDSLTWWSISHVTLHGSLV